MFIALACCASLLAQEDDGIALFTSEVQLAVVQFQVQDSRGYVSRLGSTDFQILEDGKDVSIAHFEGVGAAGLSTAVDIILLFDNSGSVVGNGLLNEELFRGSLLDGLPEVSIAIYRFGSHLVRMTRPTRDADKLRNAFEGVLTEAKGETNVELGPQTGSSMIFEAVSETIRDVRRSRRPSRKLLLVVSDGRQEGGSPDPRNATNRALESDIRIFPVVVGNQRRSYEILVGRFAGLGKATGGADFAHRRLDARAAREVIEYVADWIRHTYVVGFTPQSHATQHRHKVEVRLQPGAKAKVRNGKRFVIH